MPSPAENQLIQRMARLQEERRRAPASWTLDLPPEKRPLPDTILVRLWPRLVQITRQWLMHPLIELRNPSSPSL